MDTTGIPHDETIAAPVDQRLYQGIFTMTGDGIFVTDEKGYIVQANPALCDMLGRSEKELIGSYGADLMPEAPVSDIDLKEMVALSSSSLFETSYIHKNGSTFPVALRVTNIFDESGPTTAVIVCVRDITERKHFEAVLKAAYGFLEKVFNMTGDGIYVTDDMGYILMANKTLCDMTGYSEKEIVGMYSTEFYPEQNDPAVVEKAAEDGIAVDYTKQFEDYYTKNVNIFEAYYKRKNGSVFPVGLSVRNTENLAGFTSAIIVCVRDITDHKQFEADMQEAYDFLEDIFNTTGDGIYVTDDVGTIVSVNKSLCDMLGYSEDELVGMPAVDITPDPEKTSLDPDMIEEMYHIDYASHFETVYQKKDGTVFTVDAKINNFRASVEHSPALIVSVRDITERKQAQIALRESEDRYRSVVETARDALITVDEKGEIVSWNHGAEVLYGYTAEEAVGMSFFEMIPPLFRNTHREALRQLMQTGENTLQRNPLEGYAYTKDRQVIAVENSSSLWRSGDHIYVTSINRDITERKKAEEALKTAHSQLEIKVRERTESLEETNTALRVLLKNRDEERKSLEQKMTATFNELVMPYLDKIRKSTLNDMQESCLDIVRSNLNDIMSPFAHSIKISKLTPTEVHVAGLIKMGKNTKEIAELSNLSPRTIEGHRDNIRKKLGLKNEKINLRTYLLSQE